MDAQTWGTVVALHAWVEGRLGQALQRRHGMGLSEFRALRQLAAAKDGELRMQELAELIGLNQSSASRLVSRLEAVELTRRDHCPDDRRGVYTVITDEGRAHLEDADPTYETTLGDALDKAAASDRFRDVVGLLRGSTPGAPSERTH
ncbi:MAG: MarR family winged helix-turn-helix transcriptional regulator [Nocardioidaceae bacterium]